LNLGDSKKWDGMSTSESIKSEIAAPVPAEQTTPVARASLEGELRSRIKQQEALAQLAERALAEPDLERLLNDAVSTVALTLSVDFVKILELLLMLRAGFGWKKDLVGSILTTTSANSYARYTLDSAVPVVTDDYAEEKRFEVAPYLKDHKCVSGLSVTIAGRDGRAYGILGICTLHKRSFDRYDNSFLASVANILAGAIQRRQLEQRHELMIRGLVLPDRQKLAEHCRSRQQISGAGACAGQCAPAHHRERLEIDADHGAALYRARPLSRSRVVQRPECGA
jgi:signal transduction protein with GAF and PtsI domain